MVVRSGTEYHYLSKLRWGGLQPHPQPPPADNQQLEYHHLFSYNSTTAIATNSANKWCSDMTGCIVDISIRNYVWSLCINSPPTLAHIFTNKVCIYKEWIIQSQSSTVRCLSADI